MCGPFRAILGAIKGDVSSGGASTITQQLAKMLFTEKPATGMQEFCKTKRMGYLRSA